MLIDKIDGILLKKAFNGAVNYLVLNKEEVNALNVFPVPDGDTGTNMSLTSKSALKQVNEVKNESLVSDIAASAARGSLMGARGNSGVILSQFMRGFSESLKGKDSMGIEDLAMALKNASDTTYKAVMKPTEGTILTVGRELSDFAIKNYKNYTDILEFLKDVIVSANESLDRTPEKLQVLKDAGVVDAGGKGLCVLMEGCYKALMGEEITSEDDEALKKKAQKEVVLEGENKDIKFGYCTEFIINTDYSDVDAFRNKLSGLGDCLLVVGGEGTGVIKVHIHTNHPGMALEEALKLGGLQDIKIDNMRYQHEEILFNKEAEESLPKKVEIDKDYSFIVVSMGEGMSEVFKSIGADFIVEGGQTMNPSTEDFLKAIDSVSGKDIFIIPNNSNIILAAQQARDMSDRNVHVIESKSVPQGVSAMLGFNEGLTAEQNEENMTDALLAVKSAQITYAVRNTQLDGKDIKEGDIIGLSGKKILSCGQNVSDVTLELIDSLIEEETSVITLYRGEDVKESEADELLEILEEKYSEIDIDLIYGGQPLYYYIISVE